MDEATLNAVMEAVKNWHDGLRGNPMDPFAQGPDGHSGARNHGGNFQHCLMSPCYEVLQANPNYEAPNKPNWIPEGAKA